MPERSGTGPEAVAWRFNRGQGSRSLRTGVPISRAWPSLIRRLSRQRTFGQDHKTEGAHAAMVPISSGRTTILLSGLIWCCSNESEARQLGAKAAADTYPVSFGKPIDSLRGLSRKLNLFPAPLYVRCIRNFQRDDRIPAKHVTRVPSL
jgi:hypothetical protein